MGNQFIFSSAMSFLGKNRRATMHTAWCSVAGVIMSFAGNSIAAVDPALIIDTPQVLYTEATIPIKCFDLPASFLRKSADTFTVFHCGSWKKENMVFEGTLDHPYKKRLPDATMNMNGFYANWAWSYAWIMSIYKISETELLGFSHIEKMTCNPPDDRGCDHYATGISYSGNAGKNWTFCGEIVKPVNDTINTGGVPFIIVGEYFYIYFNEENLAHSAVARAKIADVIAAARKKTVGPWKKYYNGSWDLDASSGVGTQVITCSTPGIMLDMHTKAAYIKSIGKYIIACMGRGLGSQDYYVYTSPDGINWGNEVRLQHYSKGKPGYGMTLYSSFAGLGAASEDCSEVGDDFYLYWTHKDTFNYCYDTYYRSRIRVKPTAVQPSATTHAGGYASAIEIAGSANSCFVTTRRLGIHTITVVNASGQLINTLSVKKPGIYPIKTSGIAKGLYIVGVAIDGKAIGGKMIVR